MRERRRSACRQARRRPPCSRPNRRSRTANACCRARGHRCRPTAQRWRAKAEHERCGDARCRATGQSLSSAQAALASARGLRLDGALSGRGLWPELDVHDAAGVRPGDRAGTEPVRAERPADGADVRLGRAVAGVRGGDVPGQGRGGAEREPGGARLRHRAERRNLQRGDRSGDPGVSVRPRDDGDRRAAAGVGGRSSGGRCG